MSDIKVILKYSREEDCWVCPECDTENPLDSTKCSVCQSNYDRDSILNKKSRNSESEATASAHNSRVRWSSDASHGESGDSIITSEAQDSSTKRSEGTSPGKVISIIISILLIILAIYLISRNSLALADSLESTGLFTVQADGIACFANSNYEADPTKELLIGCLHIYEDL